MHSLADSVSEISFTAFSTQREDGADVHAYTQPIFPSSLPAANATKKTTTHLKPSLALHCKK